MGVNNSRETEVDSSQILDKYKKIRQFNDSRYGDSTLLEDK